MIQNFIFILIPLLILTLLTTFGNGLSLNPLKNLNVAFENDDLLSKGVIKHCKKNQIST